MFCTSLRRRASFAPVLPALTAGGNMGLRESRLTTHDIVLNLDATINPRNGITLSTRQLRVLLFSSSAVGETKLADTIGRIQHFASLTGGRHIAIVFLLSPLSTGEDGSATELADGRDHASGTAGIYSYTKLQAELLTHSDIPNIPILPIADLDGLSQVLENHVASMTRQQPACMVPKPPTAFEMLQLCTANPPMPQEVAFVLTDLVPSLRKLAEVCTTVTSAPNSSSPSARAGVSSQLESVSHGADETADGKLNNLRDLVGVQSCGDLVDFWKEEWTLE